MTTPSGRRADPTSFRAAQSAGGCFPPAGCGASGRLYTIPSSARVCSGGACLPPAGRAAKARFPRFLRKAWEGGIFRRLLREPSRVRVFAGICGVFQGSGRVLRGVMGCFSFQIPLGTASAPHFFPFLRLFYPRLEILWQPGMRRGLRGISPCLPNWPPREKIAARKNGGPSF